MNICMLNDYIKISLNHVINAGSWGIKLQLLHILKHTKLEEIYTKKPFHVFTMEEYLSLLKELLYIISDKMVIHRLTGDGPKNLLIEPKWSANKRNVMNQINNMLRNL